MTETNTAAEATETAAPEVVAETPAKGKKAAKPRAAKPARLAEAEAAADVKLFAPSALAVVWGDNPRQDAVTDEGVARMAASLKKNGQIQPVLAREMPAGPPKLVAGYTRLKASLLLEKEDPAYRVQVKVLKGVNNADAFLLAVIENVDRNATTPMDNAFAMRQMINHYGWTEDAVAETFGCKAAWVRESLRLLSLPHAIRKKVSAGTLSTTAALALARMDASDAEVLAEEAEAAGKTVVTARDVKDAARKYGVKSASRTLTDLRRALKYREDAASKALLAYLAGEGDEADLLGVLDACEAPEIKTPPASVGRMLAGAIGYPPVSEPEPAPMPAPARKPTGTPRTKAELLAAHS